MNLKTLMFWLALIVAIAVYAAGNYIDFVHESNRLTNLEPGQ